MKKNTLKNKQIIRAMAIGISAVMATSSMTAMAAEPDALPVPDGDDDTTANQPTAVDEAQQAVTDATNASEETDAAVEEVKEAAAEVKTEEENDLNEAIETIENIETGDATNAVKSAGDELDKAEQADADATNALENANVAAGETASIAAGVVSTENEANEKIDSQLDQMKNADTVEEAESAYEDAKKTAEDAQTAYDEAKAAYDEKKAAYDQAVIDLATAKSEYEAAVKNASEDAVVAKEKLEVAEAAAATLKEEANKAAEAMANEAAIQIAQLEEARAEDTTTQWRRLDELFEAIIRNYYVPTKLNGTVTSYKGYWDKNDAYNYFTVKYKTESGEEKTVILNYMLSNSHDGLVIFEKVWNENEVLVKDAEAEKYVGKDAEGNDITYSAEELAQAVEDGKVIQLADGTYVVKNGEGTTESAGVALGTTTSGNTTTVKEAVEGTQEESYALDENGDLVKTVTQDVTTVTYTGKSLTGEGYESEEAAEAAAQKALVDAGKALADGTEIVDTDVNVTENTEYTGTATYVSAFTRTIDVNETETWTYKSAKEVADDVREEALEDIADELWKQGYYVLKDTGSVTAKKIEDRKFFPDDYKVTGQITLTYANYVKQSVEYSAWDDFKDLFNGNKTEKEITAALKAKIEAEGGIFIKMDPINWNLKTANYYYIPGQKVEAAGTYATAKEAKEAAEKAAGSNAYKVKTSVSSETTYKYTADYQEKTTTTEEDVVMSTTTWKDADDLDYVAATDAEYEGRWVNDNYYNGNIELDEYGDEDFRNYIEDAQTKIGNYEDLVKKAEAAEKAAQDANAEVAKLQEKIKDLKENMDSAEDAVLLSALQTQLENAEINKKDAEDTLEEIIQKISDAEDDCEEVVEKLTPSETPSDEPGAGTGTEPGAGAGTGTEPGAGTGTEPGAGTGAGTGAGVTTTGGTVTVADVGVPLAATPRQTANGGVIATQVDNAGAEEEGNQGDTEEIRTIEDEETALADKPEIKTIEDEDTALAATPIGEEKISWWWLLVIALLGATGYEAYRKYRKNKMAKEGNAKS